MDGKKIIGSVIGIFILLIILSFTNLGTPVVAENAQKKVTATKNIVKVTKNIVIEFENGDQLIIKLDEDGRHDGAYYIINGKRKDAIPCDERGGIEHLSIGGIVVCEIGSYCICYRDSSGELICYPYPPGTHC